MCSLTALCHHQSAHGPHRENSRGNTPNAVHAVVAEDLTSLLNGYRVHLPVRFSEYYLPALTTAPRRSSFENASEPDPNGARIQ